ncbi:protein lon-1-like [Mytilus trossulus]|uniref:protein lon-1-like n=1 Tax=Mytilus trossulus TaxID=6551 RepID=UPI003004CAA2
MALLRFEANYETNFYYTLQLVWAKTSLLGCGIRKCNKVIGTVMSNAYLVVCNYSPAGNIMKNKILNKPYTKGKPCSKCPGYCTSESLCRKIPTKRTLYDLLSGITDTESDWNEEKEEDLEDQRKDRRNKEKEEDLEDQRKERRNEEKEEDEEDQRKERRNEEKEEELGDQRKERRNEEKEEDLGEQYKD